MEIPGSSLSAAKSVFMFAPLHSLILPIFATAISSLTLADYCTIACVAFSPAMFVVAVLHGLPSGIQVRSFRLELSCVGFYHSGHRCCPKCRHRLDTHVHCLLFNFIFGPRETAWLRFWFGVARY